jgi:AcrR family transcriptional regulator
MAMSDTNQTGLSTQARDPVRTRRRILRSATALFAAHGPDAVSVDQIAQRARCNKRMIYHYFSSKRNLYGRILEISTAITDTSSLPVVLDRLAEEYFLFLEQNPEFVALLNWENSRGASAMKQIDLAGLLQPVVEMVRRALQRDRGAGNARDIEVAHAIMTIVALCGYYFSNRHSLSAVMGLDLCDPDHMKSWLEHVKRLIHQGICLELLEK